MRLAPWLALGIVVVLAACEREPKGLDGTTQEQAGASPLIRGYPLTFGMSTRGLSGVTNGKRRVGLCPQFKFVEPEQAPMDDPWSEYASIMLIVDDVENLQGYRLSIPYPDHSTAKAAALDRVMELTLRWGEPNQSPTTSGAEQYSWTDAQGSRLTIGVLNLEVFFDGRSSKYTQACDS
jgi:hypothetical protein